MTAREVAFDLFVLLLVVVHCAIVFVALCLYIYGFDYASYAYWDKLPRIVDLFTAFGVPLSLGLAAAWLNFRFILGKIDCTETARAVGATVIFLFAFAAPVLMAPVDLVIGCIVTSEKVGKSICL